MTNQNTKTLQPFVETLKAGDPIGHLNLTLVPLRGERHGQLQYALSSDAFAAGTLVVTEVSEGGSVPELLAVNQAQQLILLIDGEELVGAKQNRILNTSVLLPAASKTRIPVSCVEQGRWHHLSAFFSAGSHSPSRLRARKSHDVSRSYQTVGAARSDQGAVWEEVADNLRSSGSHSPTMAMHDVVQQRHESLDGFTQAMAHPENACGVLAAINGRFVAMDVFDQPDTLMRIWPRLITGYAMDAIASPNSSQGANQIASQDVPVAASGTKPVSASKSAPIYKPFTAKGASALLEHLADIECHAFPSVGLGEDWRFEAHDILGQALVAEGQCLHLCAFTNERNKPDGGPSSNILPPSLRRRTRQA